MDYLRIKWIHQFADEPTLIFSEARRCPMGGAEGRSLPGWHQGVCRFDRIDPPDRAGKAPRADSR